MANRDVTNAEELNRLMGDAEESARFLQSNVMQANINEETGNYGAPLRSEEFSLYVLQRLVMSVVKQS
jgi:hypothetical protein